MISVLASRKSGKGCPSSKYVSELMFKIDNPRIFFKENNKNDSSKHQLSFQNIFQILYVLKICKCKAHY